MPQASVERFILQHGPWVLRKLAQWQLSASPPAWEAVPGAEFPVLGIPYRLEIQSGGRSSLTLAADGSANLRLRPGTDAGRVLRRELQALARADFTHRIARVAAEMKMPPPRLSLSSARTRWGSFNPRTGVRLNWRLIHCPPDLIDYVVAHELAHSREMNHSPRFWAVVAALHPDHLAARRRLRQLGPTLPVI